MTDRPPSFDELVGDELQGDERARLLRVHEQLIAAGPPADLPAPTPTPAARHPRRRRGALLAIAAALAVAIFAAGVLVGDRSDRGAADFVVTMKGTPAAAHASASLTVFALDKAGNWPMEFKVDGLEAAQSDRPFELWLTKNGKLAALCGSFRTGRGGSATVPMNAPYTFTDFDGWVVVEEGSQAPLLTT
jgi:hypothetical protein